MITDRNLPFPVLTYSFLCRSGLQDQMNQLKKAAEMRLEDLKSEVSHVEAELEEARSQASVGGQAGGKQSEEVREKERDLAGKAQSAKHIKEKADSMEDIEQQVISGLNHLGELLGVPTRLDDAPVTDLLRDIDAILETLNDELEKQQQLQQQQQSSTVDASSSRVLAAREPNPAVRAPSSHCSVFPRYLALTLRRPTPPLFPLQSPEVNRSPELDFVIAKFESPKLRLPPKLPSKPSADAVLSQRDADEDEEEEDGTWDRSFVKSASLKTLKLSQFKQPKKDGKGKNGAE